MLKSQGNSSQRVDPITVDHNDPIIMVNKAGNIPKATAKPQVKSYDSKSQGHNLTGVGSGTTSTPVHMLTRQEEVKGDVNKKLIANMHADVEGSQNPIPKKSFQ